MGKAGRRGHVVLVVEFTPVRGCRDALVQALARNVEAMVASEVGCDSYALQDGPEGTLLVLTTWASPVHANAHLTSSAAADRLEDFADLLAAVPRFKVVDPRPVE